MQYEQRIKSLEDSLQEYQHKQPPPSLLPHPKTPKGATRTKELEAQLDQLRTFYRNKIKDMQNKFDDQMRVKQSNPKTNKKIEELKQTIEQDEQVTIKKKFLMVAEN